MDNGNLEKLYKENFMLIYKFLICLTHNAEIAEDLTQETFYKAILHIDDFKGNCKLSVWLCEIAKNLWFNELKKNKKINFIDVNSIEIYTQHDFEEKLLNKEDIQMLYKKITKLDENIQKIFYMKLYGNMTFKEIGDVIGKSEIWTRVNFYRAKQKIKEMKNDE